MFILRTTTIAFENEGKLNNLSGECFISRTKTIVIGNEEKYPQLLLEAFYIKNQDYSLWKKRKLSLINFANLLYEEQRS